MKAEVFGVVVRSTMRHDGSFHTCLIQCGSATTWQRTSVHDARAHIGVVASEFMVRMQQLFKPLSLDCQYAAWKLAYLDCELVSILCYLLS